MAIYKQHGVNPLSGLLFFVIQIPLFFALFRVAQDNFKNAATTAYSFIVPPMILNTTFLGMFPLSESNIVFALLAGISFFFQAQLSIPPPAPIDPKAEKSFMTDFSRGMALQSRYVLPVIITLVSFKLSVAVVLYIIASNLFSIAHELYVRSTALKVVGA
jgi:YidC/Oxa1 family membrane protein insertase